MIYPADCTNLFCMARYLRKEFEGAKYHITVRGNGRRRVFLWDEDRLRFMQQLEESLEQYGVILYAYVLMSNHYHLLIETPQPNVSRFMQRLNTAYGMYFRNKHRSPGHVFQGRFGGKLVSGDNHLLALTRYIHLNPVKIRKMEKVSGKERLDYLNSYPWSSYAGYVNAKAEEELVDYRWRERVGGDPRAQRRKYRGFVRSKVLESDRELLDVMQASRYAIGDEPFVGWVENEIRTDREGRSKERDADVHWPDDVCVALEDIREAVADVYHCEVKDLDEHGHRAGEAKYAAIGIACRVSGLSNREIGVAFGMTGAAIGHQRTRLSEAMKKSKETRARVKSVLRAVGCTYDIL